MKTAVHVQNQQQLISTVALKDKTQQQFRPCKVRGQFWTEPDSVSTLLCPFMTWERSEDERTIMRGRQHVSLNTELGLRRRDNYVLIMRPVVLFT